MLKEPQLAMNQATFELQYLIGLTTSSNNAMAVFSFFYYSNM